MSKLMSPRQDRCMCRSVQRSDLSVRFDGTTFLQRSPHRHDWKCRWKAQFGFSSQVHLQSWNLKQNYLGKQNAVYNYAPLETRYSNRSALLSSALTVHVIWNLAWPFVIHRGAISHANVTNFARFRTSDTKRNDNKIQREKIAFVITYRT